MKGFEAYSRGFGLRSHEDKAGLRTYSEEQEFLDNLIEFAQADGTGASYAFWIIDKRGLSDQPIVLFGSEGGTHVIAENLKQLLQMLTYDEEPITGGFCEHDEEYEPTDGLERYKAWLKQNFGLDPVDDPEKLVEQAQKKYQEKYAAWLSRFGITDIEF